ncbi:PIN domain-containing protein [Powellomyces hirtus]|nr:PIN domain-containing protein [Powellomyces hirtus]
MIIVVPYVVVKELDALKEHNKKKFREHTEAVEKRVMGQLNTVEGGIVDNRTGVTLGNLARKAVDFLFKKLAAQHRGLKGQSLNDHISDSDIVGQMDNDDKILECCRFVIQRITPKTILMSNDKNLCVKALIHGITTVSNFKHSAESFLAEVRKISDLPPAPGGHPIVRGQASPVKGSTSLAGHINNIAPVAEVEMVDVQDATRSKERKRSKSKTPASPAPPMITSASRMQTRSAAQNAGQSKSLGSNTPSKRPTQPGNGSGASNSKVTPISQGHHLTDAAMFRDHSPMEVDEQKQKASQPVSKDQASRPGQQQQRSQVQPPTSSNGKQHQPTAGGSSKSKRKRGSDDQASADLMDVDGPAPATEGAKKKRKGSLTAQLGERHGKTLILTTEQLREHHGKTQEKRTKDIKAGTSTDPIDVVCRDLLDTLPPLLTGAFINLLDYSIPGGQWDRTVTVRQPWNLEDLFGIMDEHWLHFGKVIGKGFKSSLSFCRQISRELVRGRRYGKTTATLGDLRRLMHALMSLTKLLRESKCLSNASHLDKVVKGMFNKLHPTEASN